MKCTLSFMPIWGSFTPPLSLGYLKASLQGINVDCKTIDFSRRADRKAPHPGGDTAAEKEILENRALLEQWRDEILSTNPDWVGFSTLSSNMGVTRAIAQMIRQVNPSLPIILGGPIFTPEQTDWITKALEFADCAVQGEGETIIPEIAKAIGRSVDLRNVKSIWFRGKDGRPVFSGHAPLGDLNDFAFPNFDGVDLDVYPEKKRLSMMFSRGCILNCSFCTNKWNDKTQRTRTAANVFAELKRNIETYNIKCYVFNDDSLLSYVTMKEIEKFCDMCIAEGAILPWQVFGTRIDRKLTTPFVKKLAKSGLERVMFGVESFSSAVQKHMGKSSNYELSDKVIHMFADEGITAWSYLIYGYVNESQEDFEVTYNWLKKNAGLLAKVWVHPFFVNDRYLKLRPETVTQFSYQSWAWFSEHSSPEKRKIRFLRLIGLLEETRLKFPHFTYGIADPYGAKYIEKWDKAEMVEMLETWDRLDAYRQELQNKWLQKKRIPPSPVPGIIKL